MRYLADSHIVKMRHFQTSDLILLKLVGFPRPVIAGFRSSARDNGEPSAHAKPPRSLWESTTAGAPPHRLGP